MTTATGVAWQMLEEMVERSQKEEKSNEESLIIRCWLFPLLADAGKLMITSSLWRMPRAN